LYILNSISAQSIATCAARARVEGQQRVFAVIFSAQQVERVKLSILFSSRQRCGAVIKQAFVASSSASSIITSASSYRDFSEL
jgi:hypothetical protein